MDTVFIAIAAFVPMLLILVAVHEFGHFITARALGVKVLEFGLGFPPRAFGLYTGRTSVRIDRETIFVNLPGIADLRPGQSVRVTSLEDRDGSLLARKIELRQPHRGWKQRRSREQPAEQGYLNHEGRVRAVAGDSLVLADMLYSLNWMPLGGFVRLAGESDPTVPRSLASKGTGTRFLVLVAGPAMNAILPLAIFAILFMLPQEIAVGDVVVSQVAPDSPAAAAGLRRDDVVLRAGGRKIENQADLIRTINLHLGSEMDWTIHRQGRQEVIRVKPRYNPPPGQGATGISIGLSNARVERRSDPPWVAVPRSFTSTWELLVLVKQEVSSWIVGGRAPQVAGPVGIAQMTGEVTKDRGLAGWLVLVVLFSVNLAILNILPVPMLDGGRLVFVVLEWLRRGKRIPPDKEALVHLVGLVVLIGAILLVSANDIQKLLQGHSPLGG